ncbi:MAG: SufB/SufD family protein [Methylocella sp.]
MNAPIAAPRTPTEAAFAKTFDAALAGLPGGAGVRELREASFGAFRAAGLPHRRVEAWHYTDLRALMREVPPLAPPPDAAAIERLRGELAASGPGRRLVIVDGVFVPELSDSMPPGIAVRSLAAVLAEGRPDLIALLAAREIGGADTIIALNAALMQDGVVIEVEPGAAVEGAVRLVYASASNTPSARFSRSLVVVGAGASLFLAEESHGCRAGQSHNCLVAAVGDNAKLTHAAMLAGMAPGSLAIESFIARVGARARLQSFALIAGGGGLVRRQLFVRFEGPDSEGVLSGVSLLRGRKHADTTLNVEHVAPGCKAVENFRYILDEEATGVFQGKITVEKDAQKTDARMLSRALLLTDGVAMNNKPELEIFADDVACGHGATCGGLSEEQLFYLQTRGIPYAEAEALLLEAFAAELVDEIGDEGLVALFRAEVARWLLARGSKP